MRTEKFTTPELSEDTKVKIVYADGSSKIMNRDTWLIHSKDIISNLYKKGLCDLSFK